MFLRKIILTVALSLGFSGCVQSLGDFTVVSTQNVRNLNYQHKDTIKNYVEGEACDRNFLVFPIIQEGNLLKKAIDDAITKGQNKGIDGDMLVNTRLRSDSTTLIIYNSICVEVEGYLVKIDKK
jgi:hypothetical protein